MQKIYSFIIGGIFLLFVGMVQAETAAQQTTPQSTIKEVDVSGYIDTSYNYLLRNNHFTSGSFNRAFDLETNGFTLQQASIIFAKQPLQGFGFLFNPLIGRDANTMADYGMNPYIGIQNIGFDIPQAFFQYAKNSILVMVGKFNALPGVETTDPRYDTNFSRSFNDFSAQPGTVAGVRGTYDINEQLELIAGVNNGWDNFRDTGRRKTIELGINYKPNPIFSINASVYSGEQRATDMVSTGPTGTRNLINLAATLNVTEKLSFVANYDYAIQTKAALPNGNLAKALWKGLVGYINYKFNDKWQTSLRGEVFNDSNGFRTGVAQNLRGITLTLGYSPIKNLILRAETRHDFSNVSSFVNANRVGSSNNQQSYALEVLFMF